MTSDSSTLKLGLPKGSLQDATCDLFRRAGYRVEISSSRRCRSPKTWTAP